jgi:hypothetical protein
VLVLPRAHRSGCGWAPSCPLLPSPAPPRSILWHARVAGPAAAWLLDRYAAPVYGPAAAAAWARVLGAVLQVTWLLPVYVITLIVSCIWWVRGRLEHGERAVEAIRAPAALPRAFCSRRRRLATPAP